MKVLYILSIILMIVLIIFLGVKTMETILKCFLAVSANEHPVEIEIDIGSVANNKAGTDTGYYTEIIEQNPANASGKVTSVEIWAHTNLTGVIAAIFTKVDGNTFTARDSQFIGAVTAGAKRTFEVDLDVVEGDFLGMYWEDGELEADLSSGLGAWLLAGDYTTCVETVFTWWEITYSFYGTGLGTSSGLFTKTYASVDGTLLVNDIDDGVTGLPIDSGIFSWVRLPCQLDVVRNIIGTYFDVGQGLRVSVTVNGEHVEDSLIGDITISHNLNYISTFSFTLGNPKYSPLTDANIAVNSVVVITAYVNGQAFILFTGLLDETFTTYDGGYQLKINGRDYGKKLLDKTMTLISVQDSASKSYRGSMVKYLAGQAGITNVNIPTGDRVTIDHSFQDQTLWDMVQKECAIEGWYVRFDENGIMKVKTRTIKTSVTSYPVADWEYGEDKFIQLGLETSDRGIINKVIILGAIFEEETITINPVEPVEVVKPPVLYDETSTTFSKSFTQGEVFETWSPGDAILNVKVSYKGASGPPIPSDQNYGVKIIGSMSGKIVDTQFSVSGYALITYSGKTGCSIARQIIYGSGMSWAQERAFSISITIKTKDRASGGIEELEAENPSETFTSTITYTQVKATVTDSTSIGVYGERKPNNEGTLEFPLAETEAQCKRIGENIIKDSHRFIKQPDFNVQFNPKLIVGETVELTDKKIGYDEDRYLVEEVIHTIGADSEGKMKARTRIGCVFYA